MCLAYPQLIRLGYQGCNSCHASPSGGGTITGYGRTISEEISTFGGEGTGAVLAGVLRATPPESVLIGGDTRYVRIQTPHFAKSFMMQNDVEVVFSPSAEISVAATVGRYGDDAESLESRRAYVLWQPNEYVHARVGRWMPNFGLMIPDHTAVTKKKLDFGEGHESFNGELGLRSQYGEVFLTVAAPVGTTVELKGEPAPSTTATTYSYIGRAAAYVAEKAQVGVSYRAMAHPDLKWHHTPGVFGSWGITRDAYVMAEYDRDFEFVNAGKAMDVVYAEAGYEVFRGINLISTYEYHDRTSIPGGGLQLFPVPHVELLARVKYQDGQAIPLFMFHSNW